MREINPDLLKPFKDSEKYTITTDDGKKLTHLKARAIENRLNEVLGLDWDHRIVPVRDGRTHELIDYDYGSDMTVIVEITIGGSTRQGIGTVHIDEESGIIVADYEKIAENNAMFKAANKFGIGMDVYGSPKDRTSSNKFKTIKFCGESATDTQLNLLRDMRTWRTTTAAIKTNIDILIANLDAGILVTRAEVSELIEKRQATAKE
jgi:hypothetical protein